MRSALPALTRAEFFDWAEQQDPGYEFDGSKPVQMPPSPINHGQIRINLICAMHDWFSGREWTCYGLGVGLATVGDTVRYPDALVSRAEMPGDTRLIRDVVVVFEVLSPQSSYVDCILKVREYRAVPTILRYIILECSSMGLTVLSRTSGQDEWTATVLMDDEILHLPEIDISIAVNGLYRDVDFPKTDADADASN